MINFAGKYAVVTGAGRGIGYAIAKRLLDDGCSGIAMLDVDGSRVAASAAELDPSGNRTLPLACDVSDEEMVHSVFESIFKRFGRVDILVNNAGVTRDAMFHKMTVEQMKKVIDVHFYGTYNCIREVVPSMRENNYGKIVNMSSTSALGHPGQANYAAAKSAIDGLTRTLAKELGRKNVTVNSILPAYIDTEMMRAIGEEPLQTAISATPMQRLGQPSEVAALAAFLASDDSSYVSGCNIICGGAAVTM